MVRCSRSLCKLGNLSGEQHGERITHVPPPRTRVLLHKKYNAQSTRALVHKRVFFFFIFSRPLDVFLSSDHKRNRQPTVGRSVVSTIIIALTTTAIIVISVEIRDLQILGAEPPNTGLYLYSDTALDSPQQSTPNIMNNTTMIQLFCRRSARILCFSSKTPQVAIQST